jgi:hypothetical protein
VREAEVTLSGIAGRFATSDENGGFEFTDLPAGRFTITATKAGYARPAGILNLSAGPGFELTSGQLLERDVPLTRGGVIRGRVVDESGDAITAAEIRVERVTYGPAGIRLLQLAGPISPWLTDDRGEFRVYGAEPGEYLLSARSRQFGATLTTGRGGMRDRAEGLLPTYFPGTARMADAQMIRVSPGRESVADFVAVTARLAHVSGVVHSASSGSTAGFHVYLGVETSNASQSLDGGPVAADGSFTITSVPPGEYVLRARPPGSSGPGSEVGVLPISVTGDLDNLQLTTRRGTTIKGRIQWDGSAPRPSTPMRVSTRSADSAGGPLGGESTITYVDTESGTVRDDDTFELGGIVGNILFGANAQAWLLKSVTFAGRDITDTGVDAGRLGTGEVTIVMTDRITSVTGTVEDIRHRPVTSYVAVVLPAEPMTGIGAQRYTRLLVPNETGGFSVRGLPAGEYVVAAIDPAEAGSEWNPTIQKSVRAGGHRFVLTDGQALSLTLELMR